MSLLYRGKDCQIYKEEIWREIHLKHFPREKRETTLHQQIVEKSF